MNNSGPSPLRDQLVMINSWTVIMSPIILKVMYTKRTVNLYFLSSKDTIFGPFYENN